MRRGICMCDAKAIPKQRISYETKKKIERGRLVVRYFGKETHGKVYGAIWIVTRPGAPKDRMTFQKVHSLDTFPALVVSQSWSS